MVYNEQRFRIVHKVLNSFLLHYKEEEEEIERTNNFIYFVSDRKRPRFTN
jgi:hypothetical protein